MPGRLPDRIDPAPGPAGVGKALWACVLLAAMAFVLAARAKSLVPVYVGLTFLACALGLLAAWLMVRRRRRDNYDRRYGFMPWAGRTDPAPTGRTTLFRVGLGRRLSDLRLTLDRWIYEHGSWQLAETVEEAWVSADCPDELGAVRAHLGALAEQLEEIADDDRLAAESERRLALLRIEQQAVENHEARAFAQQLTRDPR